MGTSTSSRLHRLERLKGLLKAGDQHTAVELAAALDVSLRTVNRDIDLLRDSGVPIEADRGRGGGVRLSNRWQFGRTNLTVEETVDLLLALALAERNGAPLFLNQLRSVRQKISASFADVHYGRVDLLRHRIFVGDPASETVKKSLQRSEMRYSGLIKQAFLEMKRLNIEYSDAHGRYSFRDIEPQYLYVNDPAWYLLAWDYLRNDVRLFRIDRIHKAVLLDARFRMRQKEPFLAVAEEAARTI